MDEIEQRLRESADQCVANYGAWEKDKKDEKGREALAESIHELRKVVSRLEIEIAIYEREQMAEKPLPIPPHRSAQKRGPHDAQDILGDDNGPGNGDDQGGGRGKGRRSSGGGGSRGGRGKGRPNNNNGNNQE